MYFFFSINMTMSGCPSVTMLHFLWPERRHRGRALHSPASPQGWQLVLGWLAKMPSGSCGDLSGSWQLQSWRKLKEEERWKGEVRRESLRAPSVPPHLSHLVPETREQLLVFISFLCLKMGFNSVDRWEQGGNQKENRDRISAPIYLHQISMWASSSIPFYFY